MKFYIPQKGKSIMKRLITISVLFVVCGCSSIHSPHDLYVWCKRMGSTWSIGPQAQDPTICEQQLQEDLADQTPRILYVPKDVIITPFIVTARAAWVLLGRTKPPF